MKKTVLLLLSIMLLYSCNEHDFLPHDRTTTPYSSFTVSVDTVNKFYVVNMKCVPSGDTLSLMLPEWNPGAYIIMDFSKNVIQFAAADNKGNALNWYKSEIYNWKVPCKDVDTVNISYKVFSNVTEAPYEMAGRIKDNMAFMLPASVFFYQEGQKDKPVHVHFDVPADWTNMTTPLEDEGNFTFTAKDVDELYDSPFFVGKQERIFFEQDGHKYEIAYWDGLGTLRDSVIAHINSFKLSAANMKNLMGYISYNRYCFMLLYGGEGGCEHRSCQTLFGSGLAFTKGSNPDEEQSELILIQHEFMHIWNSKIFRPIELGPFDYQRAVLCGMLWFAEGITNYYSVKLPVKSGDITYSDCKEYANYFINDIQTSPARKILTLEQSSLDTWFHSLGAGGVDDTYFSYYGKGYLVGLFMDVFAVNETGGKKSLDDFLHTLDRFCTSNNRGFTKEEFWTMFKETCGGCDISSIRKYVETTEEMDYDTMLQPIGWKVNKSTLRIEEVANPTATQLKYRAIVAK